MKMLISKFEFEQMGSREKIPLVCNFCKSTFYREKHHIQTVIKNQNTRKTMDYCSIKCSPKNRQQPKVKLNCDYCNTPIERIKSWIKRHNFCNHSCSTLYQNAHKTSGTRISKLEVWIQSELKFNYPSLNIHFNKKDAINSELDIYIPSLKLAFELNGIFHYEPIYGNDKLDKTISNDKRKFQACLDQNIELYIIDTHNVKYLKKERDKKFLEIIKHIINIKLEACRGIEPL